jgi:hypothetical protein
MLLALVNLDTGLFFAIGDWTIDYELAQTFPNQKVIADLAVKNGVKNAAAVLLEGEPPQIKGYFRIANETEESPKALAFFEMGSSP